jgi:hypothetical protein
MSNIVQSDDVTANRAAISLLAQLTPVRIPINSTPHRTLRGSAATDVPWKLG